MMGQAWATWLALLCGAGLIFGDFGVTGTPSQLRLSHSGYEIISFNDEDPVSSVSLGSPRIEKKNCTSSEAGDDSMPLKVEGSLGDNREIRDSRETMRSSRVSKIGRDTRPNGIDVGSRGPTSTIPARRSGVYLTLGIPGRLVRGENPPKDSPRSVGSWDESNNRDYSGNRGELVAALIETKIRDEKRGDATKTGPKREPVPEDSNDETPKVQESDSESPSKLPFADHSRDLAMEKSETARRADGIGAAGKKTALSRITELPSIRIHHPGTYWPPASSPAIFSPLYPALGFESPIDSIAKATVPSIPDEPELSVVGSKSPIKKVVGLEPRRAALDLESNDVGSRSADARSPNERLPSFVLINGGAKHDRPMLRTVNRLSLELAADLLPLSGASLDVLSLGPKNRKPLEDQRDTTESVSRRHWERFDDSDRIVGIGGRRAGDDDDYDSTELDAGIINHSTFRNVSRVEPFDYQPDESNVASTAPPDSLIDDVARVHEATHVAGNKSGTLRNIEIPRNSTRSRDGNALRNKYKRTRSLGGPSFYQFVARITDLVLENALRYETRARENRDEAYSNGIGTV